MGREQRDRLMAAVAAIQTGLDDLAGDVLDEALLPEHRDFLHPRVDQRSPGAAARPRA